MKAAELRSMTEAELRDQESQLADQLFSLRLQASTGQLERPSKIRQAKKDLARVLTVLREKANGPSPV